MFVDEKLRNNDPDIRNTIINTEKYLIKYVDEYGELIALISELDSIEDRDSQRYLSMKEDLDEKINLMFMNTIEAIDGHQIGIIEENLLLLFEVNENSHLIDQIDDVLLNIYQSISRSNHE